MSRATLSITKIYMDGTNPDFAVGEKWDSLDYVSDGKPNPDQNPHRQALADWVVAAGGSVQAFDFTTKGILNAAVQGEFWRLRDSNGNPPGLIGIRPENAVTFIDNHDTGSTQSMWPFPSDKIMQGYAYILTHPGTPSIVFSLSLSRSVSDQSFDFYNLQRVLICSSMIISLSGV